MRSTKKLIIGSNAPKAGCGCQPVSCDESRRSVLKMAAVGVAAGLSGAGSAFASAAAEGGEQSARPKPGDVLVPADKPSSPVALRIDDIEFGSPTLVFPYDSKLGIVRSASRFNKVVLLRFEESELPEEVAVNAAGGVLAFSSICTHQGCDVNAWMAGDGLLACFCHGSMFRPLDGGSVAAGPAARALPVLPLKDEGGVITVAQTFTAPPGF